VTVDHQRGQGGSVATMVLCESDDEIEATLANPNHRGDLACEADLDRLDHIPRCETDPSSGCTIDLDAELWQPGKSLRSHVLDTVHLSQNSFRGLRESCELLRGGAEDAYRQIGWRAAETFIDSMIAATGGRG
jgi:hypothetical protein